MSLIDYQQNFCHRSVPSENEQNSFGKSIAPFVFVTYLTMQTIQVTHNVSRHADYGISYSNRAFAEMAAHQVFVINVDIIFSLSMPERIFLDENFHMLTMV